MQEKPVRLINRKIVLLLLTTVAGITAILVWYLRFARQPATTEVAIDRPLSSPLSEPLSTSLASTDLSAPARTDRPFIVYGDSRNGEEIHRQLVAQMAPFQPQAVIHVGDVAYVGTDAGAWQTFWEITQPVRDLAPFWIIQGNHEKPLDQFRDYFADQLGNHRELSDGVTFLLLDLEQGIDEAETYTRENATDRTILITHYPILTAGPHASDTIVQQAQALHGLFAELGIRLVFSGHDHNYQRFLKDGITYIITGGGGAPLYDIRYESSNADDLQAFAKVHHFVVLALEQNQFRIRAIDVDGNTIDEYVIQLTASAY